MLLSFELYILFLYLNQSLFASHDLVILFKFLFFFPFFFICTITKENSILNMFSRLRLYSLMFLGCQVSGKPIKLVGRGERMEDLEPFYPDRMAGRILGMGDVLSFVEKAQEVVSFVNSLVMSFNNGNRPMYLLIELSI